MTSDEIREVQRSFSKELGPIRETDTELRFQFLLVIATYEAALQTAELKELLKKKFGL